MHYSVVSGQRLRYIVTPGCHLSDGQGVAVGQAGWAQDHTSILRVCLQHLLSLLPSHIEETPVRKKKETINTF